MDKIWRPPKEGRIHPGLPCLDHQRRCRLFSRKKVGALLLLLVVIRIVFYLLDDSLAVSTPNLPGLHSEWKTYLKQTVTTRAAVPNRDGAPAKEGNGEVPESRVLDHLSRISLLGNTAAGTKTPGHPKDFSMANHQGRVQKQSSTMRKEASSGLFVRRPDMELALERVVDLLPGEMSMRDLLRPVEGTGKEKLREMGLRTRSYRGFFQAWEDLHFDTDSEGTLFIRDDIVQYLTQLSQDHESATHKTGLFASMTTGQIIRAYETYKYFLSRFGQLLIPYTAPFFPDHMSLHLQFKTAGRGIVLTAGDDQAHFLMTTIYSFSENPCLACKLGLIVATGKLGCQLPVEVMYLGDSDLSEEYRAELEAIDGVVTRDVSQMVNDEGWKLAGWAAKPFAILFSSFREVVFIDADSVFFKNPEILFEDPAYQKTGALFFRDRLMMPESRKRWVQQVLPKPFSSQVKQNRYWTGESAHMQESGVVVVDKWQHFLALLLVTRMNGPDRDGDEAKGKVGVYDMVYGKFC